MVWVVYCDNIIAFEVCHVPLFDLFLLSKQMGGRVKRNYFASDNFGKSNFILT